MVTTATDPATWDPLQDPGEGKGSTVPGSASVAVWSCHGFLSWNRYAPKPTAATATTGTRAIR
jgi:hypothetical protein